MRGESEIEEEKATSRLRKENVRKGRKRKSAREFWRERKKI